MPIISKNTKQLSETQKKKITDIWQTVLFVLVISGFCLIMNYPLIIPFFLVFCGFHLKYFHKATLKNFLDFGLLLSLIVFATFYITTYTTLSPYYIPVAAVSILTMLLFNDVQFSFLMAFASSMLVSFVLGGDFKMFMLFFLGSLTGSYAVREARTRGQMMGAGLLISLVHVISLYLLNPDLKLLMSHVFERSQVMPVAANGFISIFVVMATLRIFEYLFGVLTNFSLLELSDFNQPLLKKMTLEAPGTYHHSLFVSNMAEAAASEIGANGLLTRVGAYYHDIGKMGKPEYFVENQLIGVNKHDNIEPGMSRLVILNHVKEGLELARKNKLNPLIQQFITQHHGTSLVYYFYQRALEGAIEVDEVNEESFRYPGPKPQSRETAIVLLADSVEGAVRSLDEATPSRIEETVKKIMNNKFIDGQLDECNLTLREIEKISSTFTRILSAMYHGRTKYPEKKNGNSNKQSAEKSKHQGQTDTSLDQSDS